MLTVGNDVRTVAIADINAKGGTQTRVQTDANIVDEYARAYLDAIELPPVVLFYEEVADTYWLADGFHRVKGRVQAGGDSILAKVIPGTRLDAVMYSCGANEDHGLRRTDADREAAMRIYVKEFPDDLSVNKVATACRVGWRVAERFMRPILTDQNSNKRSRSQRAFEAEKRTTSARRGRAEPEQAVKDKPAATDEDGPDQIEPAVEVEGTPINPTDFPGLMTYCHEKNTQPKEVIRLALQAYGVV